MAGPTDPFGSTSANGIKSKTDQASRAEYKGKVTLEDLRLERSDYLGGVVMLRFERAMLSPSMAGGSYLYASGSTGANGAGSFHEIIFYDEKDQDAKKWAVDCARRGSGSFSVYVLVDGNRLISLGERRKKDGNGYSYNW